MMRIYQSFSGDKHIFLDEHNRHYVINVMRCRVNDECYIFDGQGHEVKAKIVTISKKEVILEIVEKVENNNESSLKIHLFQALCKGEKMDFIMQKSVELGVTEITPITTERCDIKLSSDRLEKKNEHWNNIIVSAAEQSGRAILPRLNEVVSLQAAIQSTHDVKLLLTPGATNSISSFLNNTHKNIAIFIGPEGGFSDTEILMTEKYGVRSVSLGKRILRTETASLAVISSLQMLFGDF